MIEQLNIDGINAAGENIYCTTQLQRAAQRVGFKKQTSPEWIRQRVNS